LLPIFIGYIALVAGAILAGKYFYGILFLAVTLLTLYEFYRLYAGTLYPVPKFSGMAAGSLIFIISFLYFSGLAAVELFSLIIPVALFLYRGIIAKGTIPSLPVGHDLRSIYIAVPILVRPGLSAATTTVRQETCWTEDPWLNDTGFFGPFGKHRFLNAFPKKSWRE
jgi:hypothetical protein